MKLQRPSFQRSWTSSRAFTMVEIALSIAVVAFAMVAILGVLPTGLQVQRDNRDETVINNDGAYLMEAIRTGNDRLGRLSNSVYLVQINFNNGESEVFRRTLPARAGTNFNIHDFVTGSRRNADAFYGIKVQSAVPIVAFAGHFDEFLGGGFGTLGTPLGASGIVS